MKHLLTALLFIASFTLNAKPSDDARKVLDATASKIERSGDVKAEFTITSFSGTTPTGSASGTMCLSGKKFMMTTPEMLTWFDGTTQWTYMKDSEEVNITTPTKKELQQMNPYAFLAIYKKGFNYTMKKSKLRGKDTYSVHLTAQNKSQSVQEMFIDVAQKDYTPMCIRIKEGGNWTRIAINSFAGGQHFKSDDFTFKKSDFPNADVIDLR